VPQSGAPVLFGGVVLSQESNPREFQSRALKLRQEFAEAGSNEPAYPFGQRRFAMRIQDLPFVIYHKSTSVYFAILPKKKIAF